MSSSRDIAKVSFKSPVDELLIVEAMSIADLRQRASTDHFQKLQRADFYRLIGVESGQTTLMVDFFTYPAQAKGWLLVRPGQVMRYDFSSDWAGWLLVFRPDALFSPRRNCQSDEARLLRHIDELACLHALDEEQHKWITRSVVQMLRDGSLNVDAGLRNEMLRLQLASTLLRMSVWQEVQHASQTPPIRPSAIDFKRFQQQIESDFAKHHQVQHYASAIGMSIKTLDRLCMATKGVSAKSWIKQRLCLEAKRLLAHTSMSVQSIGNGLGYDDASNFVKFFVRETGMTPLTFRRDHFPTKNRVTARS